MPIYEYQCQNGHKFEALRRFDENVNKCKICEAPVKKLVSRFGFARIWNGKGVWVFDRTGKSPNWNR